MDAEGYASIHTDNIPNFLKEAGGHRIQRVPRNDKRGRMHSSTVTVSVFLEHSSPQMMEVSEADFQLRWFSGTGAGGQHRNKCQNSVEIRHLPTGLSRKAEGRSREDNKRQAMESLLTDIRLQEKEQAGARNNSSRRQMIGSGERSDKRRTLRFQENKVTDHISGKTAPLNRILKGDLKLLWR